MNGHINRFIVGIIAVFFAQLGCGVVDDAGLAGGIDERQDESQEVWRTRQSEPFMNVDSSGATDGGVRGVVVRHRPQMGNSVIKKAPKISIDPCQLRGDCDAQPDVEQCDESGPGHFAEGEISAGWNLTCATSPQGRLRCVGLSEAAGDWPATSAVLGQVSAGNGHGCALGADQAAYCWGANAYGQATPGGRELVESPTLLTIGAPLAKVSAGGQHSCALTVDGDAYCWGRNQFGQLGDGTQRQRVEPVQVVSTQQFVDISLGTDHSCALTEAGDIYCWGKNDRGQGGDPHPAPLFVPTRVDMPLPATHISAGDAHSCALAEYNWVYCWGDNQFGQLGDDTTISRARPELAGEEFKLVELSAGGTRTCGLERNGRVWCWGANPDGNLGVLEPGSIHPSPRGASRELDFSSVSTGHDHTCGLALDGHLYCWGANSHGQLGI